MSVVFLDTETTGLDPDRHEIWELALIWSDSNKWVEYELQLPVDLTRADPTGLRIGRFYERRRQVGKATSSVARLCRTRWDGKGDFDGGLEPSWHAETVAANLDGKHLVGAVPSFDAAFLTRWLRANGQAATWHYHLIDVEALAVGYLASKGHSLALPWDSEKLSLAVGVNPEDFERHSALGDARWAKAIYERVLVGHQELEAG
jgi:hypothetical protein